MENTLVTGASGFLGSAVMERLVAAGKSAIGLDPQPAPHDSWRHVRDDLSERKRIADLIRDEHITHVIHCGGISGPMVLPDEPRKVMDINVMGTLNLLGAALDNGVRTFTQCSSVSAVGDFYEQGPIPDDYPLRPTSPYGYSKAAIDMVLHGLWGRVPADLCSLRFTGVYGPNRRTSFPLHDIVAAVVRGEPYAASAATDWPYIYVDDAADAAIAACFSTSRRQLFYYIAYPEQVPTAQIIAAAEESAGRKANVTIIDGPPQALRGPLDIAPAQRDFGFAPMINHREGIHRIVTDMLAKNA